MSRQRIIFVPQYPTPMRYQEWWWWLFPIKFEEAGFEVIHLGSQWAYDRWTRNPSDFSSAEHAIDFETKQINEYMQLKLRDDDILFLSDLSFPGLFTNVLYHKKPQKCFAFCHATSLNTYDYFSRFRYSKFPVEVGQAMLFDNIFVGSVYHYNKLAATEFWPIRRTKIVGLPYPPNRIIKPVETEKKRFLISVARPSIQKVDFEIEQDIEEQYGEIYRNDFRTWKEYCQALSESQALIVTSKEETFGYQVVDAIINNCIPIVPDAFSYPELVPNRYSTVSELCDLLDMVAAGEIKVPKLLCEARTKNFFDNIIQIMKGVRSYTI